MFILQHSLSKEMKIMQEILFQTKNLTFNNSVSYQDCEILGNRVTFITGGSAIDKSTFLKLLNKSLTKSTGEIYYNGASISLFDSVEMKNEISLISQGAFLFDTSIRDNFKIFYDFRKEEPPSDEVILNFLKVCRITYDVRKDCTTLSLSERQRVYAAIFLSFSPKVLMLDDPTSSFDGKDLHDVLKSIISFCKDKGISVVIASDDSDLLGSFAEEILHLNSVHILNSSLL